MENKSFYFKWIGFKGFNKKFLNDFNKQEIKYKYDTSESFEQRLQIYTRNLLLNLIEKKEIGINFEKIEEILKLCNLENQNRHIEKIHLILKFVDLMHKENLNKNNTNTNTNTIQIFAINENNNNFIFKINLNLINNHIPLEEFHSTFNEEILNKFNLWKSEINKNKDLINTNPENDNDNNENEEFFSKSNLNNLTNKNFKTILTKNPLTQIN